MKPKTFLAAATLCLLSLAASRADLLCLYRFEDASANVGDTIRDSSSFLRHAAVKTEDIALTAGQTGFGKAADFSGSGGKIEALLNGAGTSVNDFTIAFWMKSAGLSGSQMYLMTRQQPGSQQLSVIYEYVDNQVELFRTQGPDTRPGSQIPITDTDWHHIVYTRTGTDYALYIDGVKSDGNGIPDLLDHALTGNRRPSIARDATHTTFEFMRNPWANDVEFAVEMSEDLVHWSDASGTFSLLTPGDLEDGAQRMTYRADNAALPGDRSFFRLRVILLPPQP